MLRNGTARPPNLTTAYWLIEGREAVRPETLTLRIDGDRKALPVFSSEEEALNFLHAGGLERGWKVGETVARELLRVLSGVEAGWVTLDPLPDTGGGALIGILSLSRQSFAERHLGEEGPEFPLRAVPHASWMLRRGPARATGQPGP